MINRYVLSSLAFIGLLKPACAYDLKARLDLEPLIGKHAAANNVPPALVHRIIIRESRYNARAVGRSGALGLMQIKHATARALGYSGGPAGLLDADTNLTYGVRYLAGAYRVANGDQNRAVGFYARGYYYDAKRRGMQGALAKGQTLAETPAVVAVAAPQAPSIFPGVLPPSRSNEPPAVQAIAEDPAPVRARRNRRTTRAAAASPPAISTPAQAEQALAVPPIAADIQSFRVVQRRKRYVQQRRPADVPAVPLAQLAPMQEAAQAAAEAPARRSGRSVRRSIASDADRSAQKASAQPDDRGTRP